MTGDVLTLAAAIAAAKALEGGKPDEGKSSNPVNDPVQQRTTIENRHSNMVYALIVDYGKGLDPACNPLLEAGKQHDSDRDLVLRALEWVHLRSKRTYISRQSSNTEFSDFTDRIDGFFDRHYQANSLGTEIIEESRYLVLVLLKDIYCRINEKYEKDPENHIAQLKVLYNIINGLSSTKEIWELDVIWTEKVKNFFVNSASNIEFSLLIPDLDSIVQEQLEPLEQDFNRNLLPNGMSKFGNLQKRTLAPMLEKIILKSLTDQPIYSDLMQGPGIRTQIADPEMTYKHFCTLDIAKTGMGKIIAENENLYHAIRGLLAPEVAGILKEIREITRQLALQQLQQGKFEQEQQQREQKHLPPSSTPLMLMPSESKRVSAENPVKQSNELVRLTHRQAQLRTQYNLALSRTYDDKAIMSYLSKPVRDALKETKSKDNERIKAVTQYIGDIRQFFIFYHKQKQIISTNKSASVVAQYFNILAAIALNRKIGELNTCNNLFYSEMLAFLKTFKQNSRQLRNLNLKLQKNKQWERNALESWAQASQLMDQINNKAFHYIQHIFKAISVKQIRENAKELIEHLALFSADLSLLDLDPSASSLELSVRNLFSVLYVATESIPGGPDIAFIGDNATPRLTQAQLKQTASHSAFLWQILSCENRIVKLDGHLYLEFDRNHRYLLDSPETARWIDNFKDEFMPKMAKPGAQGKASPALFNGGLGQAALPPARSGSDVDALQYEIEILEAQDDTDVQLRSHLSNERDTLLKQVALNEELKPRYDRSQDLSAKLTRWWVPLTIVLFPFYILAGIYRLFTSAAREKDMKEFKKLEENIKTLSSRITAIKGEIAEHEGILNDRAQNKRERQRELKDVKRSSLSLSASPSPSLAPHQALYSKTSSPSSSPRSFQSLASSSSSQEAYTEDELWAMNADNARSIAEKLLPYLENNDRLKKPKANLDEVALNDMEQALAKVPEAQNINAPKVRLIIYQQAMEILHKPVQVASFKKK